ncbi:diguanylate cyclase domain-containing protein [Pseudomonas sp. LRF_L74]|uniref:diguanylate cyclase domain-containing protein n=1 Tax=Pseudomonas sp. LRF_L74 TaxID=3369422 RepID=UPI003F5FCEC2
MDNIFPLPLNALGHILDALPFGISWASLPGAQIRYGNTTFDQIFGYPPGYFRNIEQLIEEAYVHEYQRELAREHWQAFEAQEGGGVTSVPDIEIDILSGDGHLRTVLHCGLILHEEKLAVAIFKDISDIRRQNQLLRSFAYHDSLTGVANRRGLQERWRDETTRPVPRRLAFLMVDLDGFKPVNDTHGHGVGDEVLRIVAARLKAAVRDGDLVCRLGGDEFGLLLAAPDSCEQIAAICKRIVDSLAKPIEVGEQTIHISSSVGGCLYPDQAANKRELLQRADLALYRVKQSGKGNWGWYADSTITYG